NNAGIANTQFSQSFGGAVYVASKPESGPAFQMNGGTISDNKAYNGAGIFAASNEQGGAQVVISGGSITKNYARDMGAGIFEMVARTCVALLLVPTFRFAGASFAGPCAWVAALLFLMPSYFIVMNLQKKKLEK
ncbi:MAG: hypothetical protein HUJ65_01300, partial [Oscillospiraceae bacterium]|nr:hypothetical protein [Oscillospiraceae bacterium]